MPELPPGTVTFLFTDLEGPTRLWALELGNEGEPFPGPTRAELLALVAG